MTTAQAYILGASGYGGGELLRLLSQHPQVGPVRGVSRAYAGRAFAEAHPNLRAVAGGAFEGEPDWVSFAEAETPVVFSALPHGELARRLPDLEATWARLGLAERLVLIDLSGDFRLDAADAYERAYGVAHPCAQSLGAFVYGLPEWRRKALEGARRIANPGCFATAIQLALLPLARTRNLGLVAVSAATGSSGSGAAPSKTTHHPSRANDFRAYKMLAHQHEAEVVRLLEEEGATGSCFAFVPHSAPLVRGIFATVQFRAPAEADLAHEELRRRYDAFYAGSAFVRMVEESPRVAAVVGSNYCDIAVHEKRGTVVLLVALDNLVKGMAGQAIQNMNLALGYPETSGLMQVAIYPG